MYFLSHPFFFFILHQSLYCPLITKHPFPYTSLLCIFHSHTHTVITNGEPHGLPSNMLKLMLHSFVFLFSCSYHTTSLLCSLQPFMPNTSWLIQYEKFSQPPRCKSCRKRDFSIVKINRCTSHKDNHLHHSSCISTSASALKTNHRFRRKFFAPPYCCKIKYDTQIFSCKYI